MSKYSHINFKSPQSVRDEFKQALDIDPKLRGDGLEPATVAMASKIARGEAISPEQARKGYRFWSRNERFLKEDKDSAAWVSAKFWGGRSGMSWYRKLYKQIEAADSAKNEIQANVIKYEDGKYFVYSEEGKKLSKGYDSKSQAEKRLGQIEYFKSMNQIIINTNAKKSDMSEDAEYFYLKSIPITVNNSVMNEVLYTREENQKGMPSMIGRPLTIGHPVDESGNFISGQNGDGLQKHYSGGIITNTYEVANTWYVDAKIEKKVLDVKSPELYESISNKEDLPVSTGLLFAQNEMKGFNERGEEYKKVAINMQFDHLAALLDEAPAGGDDTVAKFNSLEVPVFHVNELIEQQIPDEIKEEVETMLSKASNSVKEFFSTSLHKFITKGYNKQETNINVNDEVDTMKREDKLAVFGLNAESTIADADLDKMLLNMAEKGIKQKASESEDDEDEEINMKDKKKGYAKNSSDNHDLNEQIEAAINNRMKAIEAETNADLIAKLAANSECPLDKVELEEMSANSLKKLEGKYLGTVNMNTASGSAMNSHSASSFNLKTPTFGGEE